MKRIYAIIVCAVLTSVVATEVKAQEWSASVDLYSSYLWRGSKFGTGAAVQPTVEFSKGGFSIGAWGSTCIGGDEAFEADLYAGYEFDFGLGITVTDYYFGGEYFDGDVHSIEPTLSYSIGGLSLTAAYMMGKDIDDAYAEIGYSFSKVDLFVGAGNGQYTKDGDFMICNVGIGTSVELPITEKFSLPISGQVVLNPSTEGFYVAVGITL